MKRLLAFFLSIIILVSASLVPIAHAEVATATLVCGAAVVTALTACGILVGSHIAGTDVSASAAISQAWAETSEGLKNSILNTVRVARTGAALATVWTAATWQKFVEWAKDRFPSFGSSITVGSAVISWDSSVITYSGSMPVPTLQKYIPYDSSGDYRQYDIALTGNSRLGVRRDTVGAAASAYVAIVAAASDAVLLRGSRDTTLLGTSLYPATLFKPLYNTVDFTVPYAYKYRGYASWTDYTFRKANAQWFISDSLSSPWAGGELVIREGNVQVKKDSRYTTIIGDFTSIGVYVKACADAGVVIGIPLNDGTVSEPSDDAEPVTLPVDVEKSFYPDEGVFAPPVVLAPDDVISIPLPVTDVTDLPLEDGESVELKDVADLPLDLPKILTKTPTETIPRVITGDSVGVLPDTDTGSIVIPDSADDTIPNNPSTPSESDDTDTNKLKLPKILLSKFPFCIPWDFYNAIKMLQASPVPPKWTYSLKIPRFDYNWQGTIDLSQFNDVATVLRWLLCAIWIVSLIMLTKNIIK